MVQTASCPLAFSSLNCRQFTFLFSSCFGFSIIKYRNHSRLFAITTDGIPVLYKFGAGVSVVPSTPACASHDTHLLQHPHPPRLPSGLKELVVSLIAAASSDDVIFAGVLPRFDIESLDIPTPPPSTMQRDSNALDPTDPKHLGNQSFTISAGISPPTNLVSSVSSSDPPPVPESFPREPVRKSGRGEGWPYAPQRWPKPDDKWGWRVGKRASPSSLWMDRYVMLPTSLLKGRRTVEFASRKNLLEYCKLNFPQMTDPSNILKAFDWKVPAPKDLEVPDKRGREPIAKRDKPPPTDGDENWLKPKKQCRAGNPHCILTNAKDCASESLVCHICCSEPNFCRECKCILCFEVFRPNADDFSVVRCCKLPVAGQGVCGHAAHLECALNSQLAGVIKKNGLDLEYICRRCDRKTDLRDTVSHLVEAMDQNATKFTVENILQLALRTVQDPEDEAQSPWATLIADALKKIREGAVIVEVYKELTEQLHGLQSGRSRAMGRDGALEDSPHHSEANSAKLAAHVISVGSPDFSTLRIQEKSQSKPLQQGGSNDTSLVDALTVCHGGDEVATTSDTSLQPVLNLDPSDFLPFMWSPLNESAYKHPTLYIEEHLRQCEATTDRVTGAGQLNPPPGTLKVLNSAPSLSPHLCITSFLESEVVEASNCGDSRSELVVPVSTSSGATRRSLSNSGGDDVVSGQIVEPPTVSSSGMTPVAGLEAKYEGQISEALEKLERAQAAEYASAKASLNVQKNIIIQQYRKMENVFGEKENHGQLVKDQKDEPRAEIDHAMNPVGAQLQEGQKVFESMLAIVSHGFGQVSKELLQQFLNWPPSDTAEA